MSTFGAPIKSGTFKGSLASNSGCDKDAIGEVGEVVIVDRGGCDFYNKTLNFASAGAELVVIAMDIEQPVRPGVLRW